MPDKETVQKVEEILAGIVNKEIALMSADMKEMKHGQAIMAESHKTLALAAQSMAETFRRSEERQARLEETTHSLYKDKGISPNVFFLVTATLCSVIILGAAWLTDTSVKATLTSFEAGKRQLEKLEKGQEQIMEEVKDGNQN